MARLIDADRLLRDPYFQEDRWPESHLIRMAVGEQPTVDSAPKWIPVTERLPDNNHPVLVRCVNTTISGGYVTHIGSCDMKKFWFLRTQPGTASFPVQEWQVTHWMPLPEPPRVQGVPNGTDHV